MEVADEAFGIPLFGEEQRAAFRVPCEIPEHGSRSVEKLRRAVPEEQRVRGSLDRFLTRLSDHQRELLSFVIE
ncbi:MAG: hypothetical protein C4326_04440 [Ignavibacteria bacterium]